MMLATRFFDSRPADAYAPKPAHTVVAPLAECDEHHARMALHLRLRCGSGFLGRYGRNVALLLMIASLFSASAAKGDPVVDFFERLGKPANHTNRKTAQRPARPAKNGRKEQAKQVTGSTPTVAPSPALAVETQRGTSAQPTATAMPIEKAIGANPSAEGPTRKSDLPYGVPVPNRPGLVISPFAPNSGYVDVHGIPSGLAVKDPFSGKFFLTP
jgi:hypothetical protein